MKKFALLKNNNKGAAIVTAIITSVFVLAMAVIVMSVAYSEYQIRTGSFYGQENDYDASSAMTEVKVGIQNVVSEAINSAYTQVMADYANNKNNINETFEEYFLQALYDYKPANSSVCIATKKSTAATAGATYNGEAFRNLAVEKYLSGVSVANGDVVVSDSKTEVTFKNVKVSYTDNDRTSVSIADVVITIPDIGLKITSTPVSDTYEYAIVSGGKIVHNSNLTHTISGNIVSGGLENKLGGTLNINTDSYYNKNGVFVSSGDIDTDQSATTTINSSLWAKNLNVGISSKLTASGKTYVANDLNLSNTNASVTLEGEYHGFGTSKTDSNESSAILINGKKTTLDLSGLDTLELAGLGFIGQSSSGTDNIATGGSVSIKADEKAYLVPVDMLYTGDNMIDFKKMIKANSGVDDANDTNKSVITNRDGSGNVRFTATADYSKKSVDFEFAGTEAEYYTFEYYNITCKPNTRYVLSFDVEQSEDTSRVIQCYIFNTFSKKSTEISADTNSSGDETLTHRGYVSSKGTITANGTNTIVFTTGTGTNVSFRLGVKEGTGNKVKFSNICLYKETEDIDANPMIYSTADEAAKPVYIDTTEKVWKTGTKTLASYNVSSADGLSSNSDSVAARRYIVNASGQYIVYYYMSFKTVEDANNYYRDYFFYNGTEMQNMISKYVTIKNQESGSSTGTIGSIYTYTKGAVEGNYSISAASGTVSAILSNAETNKTTYTELCCCPFDVSASESSGKTNPFDVIVKSSISSGYNKYFAKSGKTYAVVIDGDYTYESASGFYPDLCLIIATGNVTIEKNFNGLIITKGSVTLKADVRCDNGTVSCLKGATATDGTLLDTFFTSGEGNLGESSSGEGTGWEDIASLVEFKNEKSFD